MEHKSLMENMERLTGNKVIVTGGTGFIGSHLVKQLINLKADVLVIDIQLNKNSYFSEQQLHKKVPVEYIDIARRNKIKTVFDKYQPEFVFHLAAEAIVENSYNNPFKTFQTNVMGTVSILEAARYSPSIKGVIVASSDKAYGKTNKAYTEHSPLQGDHPYDVSKSATDLIAQTYFKTYGLPTVITRFGNVYGEGDLHMNRIVPGVCESVIKKSTLQIRSDGKYVRDYLYVKDVADGYIFLMKHMQQFKGEAFNFSSNETLSVIDVVKLAQKILHTEIKYNINNTAKNEIPYQHLDDSKIKKHGWKTKYSLSDTLPQIYTWYKKR